MDKLNDCEQKVLQIMQNVNQIQSNRLEQLQKLPGFDKDDQNSSYMPQSSMSENRQSLVGNNQFPPSSEPGDEFVQKTSKIDATAFNIPPPFSTIGTSNTELNMSVNEKLQKQILESLQSIQEQLHDVVENDPAMGQVNK